jgi:hypothetical protein
MAYERRDTAFGTYAGEVAHRLTGAKWAQEAAYYESLAREHGAPDIKNADLKRHAAAVARLADSSAVALGAWVQTARMAAATGDMTFLEWSRRNGLPEAPAGLRGDAAKAFGAVKDELGPGHAIGLPKLSEDLDRLLVAAAR